MQECSIIFLEVRQAFAYKLKEIEFKVNKMLQVKCIGREVDAGQSVEIYVMLEA